MSTRQTHDFGRVDEKGDAFEFVVEPPDAGTCVLVAVVQTERGPRRTEIASRSRFDVERSSPAAVKELSSEMGEDEREKKPPTFRVGFNRISPLVGRELGVLLIALMEEGAADRVDALLHAWRELAREERWWLYSKAAAPGQQRGTGWRRALFHALSETSETRAAPTAEAQKKKLWEHQRSARSQKLPPEGYAAQPRQRQRHPRTRHERAPRRASQRAPRQRQRQERARRGRPPDRSLLT